MASFHTWKETKMLAWPLPGRHLNFQAGPPWQPVLMTKFREEGEEDRGPWLVDQISFHPTLQFRRRSKYSDISPLPPICTNELQCYVENSFSPLQGSLRSHRKGLCHQLDTGSKWLHPLWTSKTLGQVDNFSFSRKSVVKGYGLNLIGKRKPSCDKWCSLKGYIKPRHCSEVSRE